MHDKKWNMPELLDSLWNAKHNSAVSIHVNMKKNLCIRYASERSKRA